jgi:hypothetical protein
MTTTTIETRRISPLEIKSSWNSFASDEGCESIDLFYIISFQHVGFNDEGNGRINDVIVERIGI